MTHQCVKVLKTSSKNETILKIPSIVCKVLKDKQCTPRVLDGQLTSLYSGDKYFTLLLEKKILYSRKPLFFLLNTSYHGTESKLKLQVRRIMEDDKTKLLTTIFLIILHIIDAQDFLKPASWGKFSQPWLIHKTNKQTNKRPNKHTHHNTHKTEKTTHTHTPLTGQVLLWNMLLNYLGYVKECICFQ